MAFAQTLFGVFFLIVAKKLSFKDRLLLNESFLFIPKRKKKSFFCSFNFFKKTLFLSSLLIVKIISFH